jgi:hypothetical protein
MLQLFALLAAMALAFGSYGVAPSLVSERGPAAAAASTAGFSASAVAAAADTGGAAVPFNFGRYGVLQLTLQDSGVVTPRTRFTRTTVAGTRAVAHEVPRTLAGTVAGDPTSVVRLTVAHGWVAGFVRTGARLLSIAPDDYEHPTKILVSEPEPAPPGVPGVRDAADPVPSRSQPMTADPTPTPTPTLTPPTPLPTPSPTTIATSIPAPVLPTLPSPFPIAVWPTLSPLPSPVPAITPPAVSVGVYNCRIIKCNIVQVDVLLDADPTYSSPAAYGNGCASRQASILNMVDGIYMDPATRVHFVAVQVNCRQAGDSALGGPGTTTAAMLADLKNAWDGDGPNRSIVHLAVGFDFAAYVPPTDKTIGRAFQPGVCSRLHPDDVANTDVPEVLTDRIGIEATPMAGPISASIAAGPVDVPNVRCPYGYSLYQGVRRPGTNYVGNEPTFLWLSARLSAHEIGHNLNADHSLAVGCGPAHTGTLMCEEIQDGGPNSFSPANAKRIREWAETKEGSILGS